MAICQKCIIPDSFPGVTIENGLCSFCRDSMAAANSTNGRAVHNPELLEKILTREKTENGNGYDCLVPVSGGKDSAYVLYYVVRCLKLKPFAVFFDSGFASETAKLNVIKICTRLGVAWGTVKTDHYARRKAVIESIHMSKITGRFFHICANCENNLRTMAINTARAKGIKFILWGSTDYEDAVYRYDGNKGYKTFRESFGNSSLLLTVFRFVSGPGIIFFYRTPQRIIKHSYYIIKDNFSSRAPGGLKKLNPFYQVDFGGKIQVLYFFHYIQYNPLHQVDILRKELGWDAPSGREARIDCKLHCLANYAFARQTSISKDGFNFANLVRAGLMERAEALKRERNVRESFKTECNETLAFFGFEDYNLEPLTILDEQNTEALIKRELAAGQP